MAIEIGDLQLHRVHRVEALEQAGLVYHRVPGLEGNVAQDLGRDSVRLAIEGIFYGPTAFEDLESLREMHQAREPVDFLAELIGEAYFSEVTLERLEVRQDADRPDQISFALTVAEYVPPPEPEAPLGFPDVDLDILDQAQSFMDLATLPDLLALGSIPDVTDPLEPLSGALGQVEEATAGLEAASAGLKSIFGVG